MKLKSVMSQIKLPEVYYPANQQINERDRNRLWDHVYGPVHDRVYNQVWLPVYHQAWETINET
jgi:predicted N-formylglutamate amidohydrolase